LGWSDAMGRGAAPSPLEANEKRPALRPGVLIVWSAQAQAAAEAFTSSDLFSMTMAASRSICSMAATSRAMRSSADS